MGVAHAFAGCELGLSLDLYASGLTAKEILDEMPDLEMDDLKAALKYAARQLDHPIIAA